MLQLNFNGILNTVKKINKHYEKIAARSGEHFNVFQILKLQSSENRLHSAFIAELLNPKGSHGLKDEFLKLFITQFEIKHEAFETVNATVNIELHTGFINTDYTEGGRIDICITDPLNRKVIIENKIYASDQLNQLVRYHNYDPKADLFYLTLDGKAPKSSSHGSLNAIDHFRLVSYKNNIMAWLILCREKAVMHPILRETISQYINLIKQLTGQTINDTMNEEVANLITENQENLEAAFILSNTLDHACAKLIKELEIQAEEISKELGIYMNFNIDFNKNYKGIFFSPNGWQKLNIAFQFQSHDKNLVFGLARNELDGHLPQEWYQTINERLVPNGRKTNDWWPFHEECQPYTNWDLYEPWAAILSGEMKVFIKEKVKAIIELFADQKF